MMYPPPFPVQGHGKGPLPPPPIPWPGYAQAPQPMMVMPQPQPPAPAMSSTMPTMPPVMTVNSAPSAPPMQTMAPPQIPAGESAMDAEQREFLELARARQMDLPPDPRQKVQKMVKKEGARTTKNLHSAVHNLGNARTDLEEALQARYNLIASWKNFLTEGVKIWQDHTALFQMQEKDLQERIQQAQENFNLAKAQAAASQEAAGKIQTIEIKDEDEEEMAEGTATADQSSTKISSGLENLSQSLQQLKEQAATIEIQEKAAKRPRTSEVLEDEGNVHMSTAPPPGAKALQPFASPGCP